MIFQRYIGIIKKVKIPIWVELLQIQTVLEPSGKTNTDCFCCPSSYLNWVQAMIKKIIILTVKVLL